MKTMTETLVTPVAGRFDVIVCGGGIAGVAAAVAAARDCASVLLLEKTVFLGGLATTGLVSWYEPICDSMGTKRMYGLPDELLHLAIRHGDNTLPEAWKQDPDRIAGRERYATFFSPTFFAMVLDRFVQEAGVRLLLDTLSVRPVMDGSRCRGVVVENRSGRALYEAAVVIDVTGDADILHRAGVPCKEGKNYLTYIGYQVDGETLQHARTTGNLLHSRKWVNPGSDLWGKGHPEGEPLISGLDAEEVTAFILKGRRMLYDRLTAPDAGHLDVTVLPGMAQLRMTRRIDGLATLTEADEGKPREDAVAVAGDFAHPGKVYAIPFGTLYHPAFPNLLTAGRSASGEGWGWEVLRVIPVAAATGEAAGTAAAMAVRMQKDIPEIPLQDLQQRLQEKGVRTSLT